MTIEQAAAQLERSAEMIRVYAEGVDPVDAVKKPAPDKWSIIEVLGHLLLEEQQDFRPRMELIIYRPGFDFPPLDVDAAVKAARLQTQKLDLVIRLFQQERATSLRWLRSLDDEVLERYHEHPEFGRLSCGDLLHAWVAHDLLHLRQLLKLQHGLVEAASEPYGIGYAGAW